MPYWPWSRGSPAVTGPALLLLALVLFTVGATALADEAWQDIKDIRPPVVGSWHQSPPNLRSVVALGDGRTPVAVGDNGTVLRSDDGHAAEWRVVRWGAGAANLYGIAALGDGRPLVAVGGLGSVLRGDDSG